MDTEVFEDLSKSGPGIWYMIHIMSVSTITQRELSIFTNILYNILFNLQCLDCRDHSINYIKQNPLSTEPPIYLQQYNITIYVWTWKFHDSVSKFLGKTSPSIQESYFYYRLCSGIDNLIINITPHNIEYQEESIEQHPSDFTLQLSH